MKGLAAANKALAVALLSVSVLLIDGASCSSRQSQAGKVAVVVKEFPTHGVREFMNAADGSEAYITFMLSADQTSNAKSASYVKRAMDSEHDFGYLMTEPKEGDAWDDTVVANEIKAAKASFKKNFDKTLKFVLFPSVEDEQLSKRLEGLAKKSKVDVVKPTLLYPSSHELRRAIHDNKSDSCIVLIDNLDEGEETLKELADRIEDKDFAFFSLTDFVKAKPVAKRSPRGKGLERGTAGGRKTTRAGRGRLAEGKTARNGRKLGGGGKSSGRKTATKKLINDSEEVVSPSGRRVEGKRGTKRVARKTGASARKALINASEEVVGRGRTDRRGGNSKKTSRSGKGRKPLVNESDLPASMLGALSGDAKKKTMPKVLNGGADDVTADGIAALALKASSGGYILPGRQLLNTRPIPKASPIILAAKGAAKVATPTAILSKEGEGTCKKGSECPVAH